MILMHLFLEKIKDRNEITQFYIKIETEIPSVFLLYFVKITKNIEMYNFEVIFARIKKF